MCLILLQSRYRRRVMQTDCRGLTYIQVVLQIWNSIFFDSSKCYKGYDPGYDAERGSKLKWRTQKWEVLWALASRSCGTTAADPLTLTVSHHPEPLFSEGSAASQGTFHSCLTKPTIQFFLHSFSFIFLCCIGLTSSSPRLFDQWIYCIWTRSVMQQCTSSLVIMCI